jgi:hypothetical protein
MLSEPIWDEIEKVSGDATGSAIMHAESYIWKQEMGKISKTYLGAQEESSWSALLRSLCASSASVYSSFGSGRRWLSLIRW